MKPNSQWQYQTLEMSARQNVQETLNVYRQKGFQVLHAHYAPAGNYRFLLGKNRFAWFTEGAR